MGVSENSVPLNPMVNDHNPYYMAISLEILINPIFRQTHIPNQVALRIFKVNGHCNPLLQKPPCSRTEAVVVCDRIPLMESQ